MNKDLVQGPLLQQLPPQDSSTDMFSLSSIPRSSSSQSTLCQRPIVISDPTAIPSQSSWDVESLGSPPRKATPDRQRTPKPLPSLPLTGESLRRSNSGASRRAQCTPDLYDGQSEASESLPATPLTPSRSPTPGPSSYATSPFEESKQKATEDPQEDPEIAQERDQFVYERNIIYHHRFPREDVPYMQSYSDVSLWNDYCTNEFLRKLMPPGSPTFFEYTQPPIDILDIGCGRGYWAAEAATTWKHKNAYVTAFDIVDLGRPLRQSLEPDISAHILWVQGNFLKGLPFPPRSFNLIRLACLSLAVPIECWHYLLEECKRVLRPCGRIEIIDDELYFPDIQSPPTILQRGGSLHMKQTRDPNPSSGSAGKSISRPSPLRRSPTSGSKTYTTSSPSTSPRPDEDYQLKAATVCNMENIFQSMLLRNYNIFPRPHEFLESLLTNIFGKGRTNCMFRADIVIPTSDSYLERGKGRSMLAPRFISRSPNTARATRRPPAHEESHSHSSGSVAPKAMRILGGAGSTSTQGPKPRYQPSGFIVLPDTFVPCEPDMLEMHACKNMHSLLSCKHAIAEYVQRQTDDAGVPWVSDEEFDELAWTYDSFKRTRFNWPETYPGLDMHEDIPPPSSGTKQLFNRSDAPLFGRRRTTSLSSTAPYQLPMPPQSDEIIPIRTIRVYQAFRPGLGFETMELIPLPGFEHCD